MSVCETICVGTQLLLALLLIELWVRLPTILPLPPIATARHGEFSMTNIAFDCRNRVSNPTIPSYMNVDRDQDTDYEP